VREASDIVDVISQYVTLKKRGANHLGLCPFHSEKAPSFTVSHDKGFFKCFGCGAGGNVFSFVMQRENMNFPEAVEFLAKRANLEIPRERTYEQSSAREKLFSALAAGHQFFRKQFEKSSIPKQYLKSRDFSARISAKMELGYAPDGWDNFAGTHKSDFKNYLAVGLLRAREKGDGYYDYFRNRLIFPIKDLSGRVCAFGGRYLGEEDEHNAKYLNSPESLVYNKGSLLYALGENRSAIRQSGFVYLVEGYTDLLRLLECGVENCAAGLGTAFTSGQAKLLRRYTEKAVLLYDGDEAGNSAAVKAGRLLLNAGADVEVIILPKEHDPDTYLIERGGKGLESVSRFSLLNFQYQCQKQNANSPSGREAIAKSMLETVVMMPDEIKRSLAFQEISETLNIPEDALRNSMKKVARNTQPEIESETTTDNLAFSGNEKPEVDFIKLLLNSPQSGEEIFTSFNPEYIGNTTLRDIFETMKSYWLKGELKNINRIIDHYNQPKIQNFLAECAIWEIPGDTDDLIRDYENRLKMKAFKKEKIRIDNLLKEAQSKGDFATELALLKKIKNIRKAELEGETFDHLFELLNSE